MTPIDSKKNLKIRCLLAAFVLAALISFIYALSAFEIRSTYPLLPVNPQVNKAFPGSDVIRKGNLNGIPLGVPGNYIYFPFHYLDKNMWDPKPGDIPDDERTYEHGFSAFSLYVHWPDMQPRNWTNNFSFFTKDKNGGNDWLMVSVQSDYISSPRPPKTVDNGFARVLKGKIERLAAEPVDGGPWGEREKVRVRYEFQGVDEETGLPWTVPVGPYTELFHTWNMALYWQGDKETVVTDLIECYNGKLSNPNSYQECEHHFEFSEMKTYVNLTYPRTWLPQWAGAQGKG